MSAFDDRVKRQYGVVTEDWCRGLYARHPEPRDATLAIHSVGMVTIVYMPDPFVDDYTPVCEECYQVALSRTNYSGTFEDMRRKSWRMS